MLKITFRYKDQYTRDKWAYQSCICESVEKCINWYGLDVDCYEYEILEIKEV